MDAIIRKIQPADDAAVAKVIRNVLIEHNVPKVGTAYADASLDRMYETYNKNGSAYFVIEESGTIIGCAGIAHLDGGEAGVCELQKMYFLPQARGRGLGTAMMQQCLAFAKESGYTHCYLETMPYMLAAQKLYKQSGFDYIDTPMGCTGHTSCPVWMLKKL